MIFAPSLLRFVFARDALYRRRAALYRRRASCASAGHPEFSTQIVRERILPALQANGRLSAEEQAAALVSFEVEIGSVLNQRLVRDFLLAGRRRQGSRL